MSHDYQVAFLETADFATHIFDVRIGTVLGAAAGTPGATGTNLVVNGNSKDVKGVQTLFAAPFTTGWQNLAMVMDFNQK